MAEKTPQTYLRNKSLGRIHRPHRKSRLFCHQHHPEIKHESNSLIFFIRNSYVTPLEASDNNNLGLFRRIPMYQRDTWFFREDRHHHCEKKIYFLNFISGYKKDLLKKEEKICRTSLVDMAINAKNRSGLYWPEFHFFRLEA